MFLSRILFYLLIVQVSSVVSKNRVDEHINLSQKWVNFLKGNFNPALHSAFQKVPLKYSLKKSIYLQKEAIKAFQKMAKSAQKEGIRLYIVSGTRNYMEQKNIWEKKFNMIQKADYKKSTLSAKSKRHIALQILNYSSMPGTSRHHWGTDIDIIYSLSVPLTNLSFESGYGLKVYQWLRKNAIHFGFCQPYLKGPEKRNQNKYRYGYQEEKWHWSYISISKKYLSLYKKYLKNLKPIGFKGYDSVSSFYTDYIFNIHPECL